MNALGEIVVSNALLVVLFAVVIAVAGRFWKNPQGLHLLWLLVLLKFVTPPLLTIPIRLPSTPTAIESNHAAVTLPGREVSFPAYDGTSLESRQDRPPLGQEPIAGIDKAGAVPLQSPIPWLRILAGLWGIGVASIASWQTFRILRFRNLFHSAQPPSNDVLSMVAETGKQLGLRRIPRVRMFPVRVSPMVLSVGVSPQLLLPVELFERLEPTAQRSLLAHELAHVRRKDHLVRLLELLVTTLFWWHPVVWWACWELQRLEDLCCDAVVVSMIPESTKVYATALMNTLDFLCDGSIAAPLGVTATQSFSLLTKRIAMLKDRTVVKRLTFGGVVVVVIVAALPMSLAFAAKPLQTDDPAAVRHNEATESTVASPQTVATEATFTVTSSTPPAKPAKPVAKTDDAGEQPLSTAVTAYNQKAARIGVREPPLTEEEVIAAIRGWNRTEYKVDDETYAFFQKIADSKSLPAQATLDWDPRRTFRGSDYIEWSATLTVTTRDWKKGIKSHFVVGPSGSLIYSFPIRGRLIHNDKPGVLDLVASHATDADLERYLKGRANLTDLWLGGTDITDAGLAQLKGITSLKLLTLDSDMHITDAGLEHLKGLENLERLSLEASYITDTGLAHLKALTKLRHLSIRSTMVGTTRVSDNGLAYLEAMKKLEGLDLFNIPITDAGLAHLRGLTNLQSLHLEMTKVTDEGVRKLQQALPHCKIEYRFPMTGRDGTGLQGK